MKNDEQKIINLINKVIRNKSKNLHEPLFDGNEKKYLLDCIDTGYVSTVGKYVDRFENKIAKYTKSKYAIAIINGTSALHILMKYFGITEKDEVILPSLTFVATANVIKYCNATPNFVDSEHNTLGICPVKLANYLKNNLIKKGKNSFNKRTNRRVKAVIAVHLYGLPCKINEIKKICKKYNLILIEDAAEGMGSFLNNKHLGTFGQAGVISFNGNKPITAGGGGIILTSSKKIAKNIKHLSTTAKLNHPWKNVHDQIGYNYRMTNLNAAVGCAQLENIKKIILSKRKNFESYNSIFKDSSFGKIISESKNSFSNYWLITLVLKNNLSKNKLLKSLHQNGYKCRSVWKPLHTLKIFKDCPSDNLKNCLKIYDYSINLPSSPIINYK